MGGSGETNAVYNEGSQSCNRLTIPHPRPFPSPSIASALSHEISAHHSPHRTRLSSPHRRLLVTITVFSLQVGPIRVAFLGLAAGAALSIVTTIFLPALNDRIGTVNVWLCGEVSFAVCMVVTPFIPRPEVMWWPSIIVGAFSGIGYATHSNNPYIICEDIADRHNPGGGEEHRGFANSLVNLTITVAQIIIGAVGGLVVQATGNAHWLFTLTGAIMGIASLVILLFSRSRCGMVDV